MRNFPQNFPEIFTTFRNSCEFHSQNFYILCKIFINNYYIYIKLIRQFQQFKIARMFIHMNVGKYGVSGADKNCIMTFGVIQENGEM